MCGRYYRRSDKQRIAEAFSVGELDINFVLAEWDFNVAPTTFQPVIREARETGDREMVLMRWGLVPYFTEQLSDVKGISTINARAESVLKSPTWRTPFKKRRCLVPADGFTNGSGQTQKTNSPLRSRWFMMRHSPLQDCGTHGRMSRVSGFSPSVLSPRRQTNSWRRFMTECR
jgi:putative SOS response-associated peptidase YedK